MKTESFLMKFFRKLGWDSVAWSLRRLHCPVKKNDLVLEIGSGSKPYFRANVLCDAYLTEASQRHFTSLIHDRPTVLAFAENLPFKDNAFDFIIASHVLEHSSDPERFLTEIQRVGRAGYIETPNALFERICGYSDHRLEIDENNGELVILKKKGPVQDEEIKNLFTQKTSLIFSDWVSKNPFHFHVRYHWSRDSGGIKYRMVNPEYKFNWLPPPITAPAVPQFSWVASTKRLALFLIRKLFSQRKRNKRLKIENYLICPACRDSFFEKLRQGLKCGKCASFYLFVGENIIDFVNQN